MPNFKAEKLKAKLKLCVNHLKMLEKTKTEEIMKARREVAGYVKNKRTESANILVGHIIREDCMVEAMEIVELYCNLLLSRLGMLEHMTYCEENVCEFVATLLWVAPRLSADIQELTQVSLQLENKFGKPFAQQSRSNMSGTVNPKVIHLVEGGVPKKSLVEKYLIEIARDFKIKYEPDPTMLLEHYDDIPAADLDKPFIPDSSAGPLPHKPNPYYQDFPFGSPPTYLSPSNPGVPIDFDGPSPSGPPPPYPPPPVNPNLPYPQPGVQPLAYIPPDNLDLSPAPHTYFPPTEGNSGGGGASGGAYVDFDDLNRRFKELKKRK